MDMSQPLHITNKSRLDEESLKLLQRKHEEQDSLIVVREEGEQQERVIMMDDDNNNIPIMEDFSDVEVSETLM